MRDHRMNQPDGGAKNRVRVQGMIPHIQTGRIAFDQINVFFLIMSSMTSAK